MCWNSRKKPKLEDAQLRDEIRRRSMEFDQPGEEELEAAGGGKEDNAIPDIEELSDLRPEQQIRNEEEIRTPPRGVSQRMGDQQPGGPQDRINGMGSVPGHVVGQWMYPADRNRPHNEWSPVEKTGRNSVQDATGHGKFADRKSILEDMEDNRTRALGATGGTDDHKSSLVQWFYQLGTVSASV